MCFLFYDAEVFLCRILTGIDLLCGCTAVLAHLKDFVRVSVQKTDGICKR